MHLDRLNVFRGENERSYVAMQRDNEYSLSNSRLIRVRRNVKL